jgi:hypothetical protein
MMIEKACSKAGDGEVKEEVSKRLGCGHVLKKGCDKVKLRDCD